MAMPPFNLIPHKNDNNPAAAEQGAFIRQELTHMGWQCPSRKDLIARGEPIKAKQQGRQGHWLIGATGALAFIKRVRPDQAAFEYLAVLFADKAGIPGPKVNIAQFAVAPNKIEYACISPALGETQETLEDFLETTTNDAAVKKISQDISFSLPLWEIIGHADCHDKNIIVASWHNENEDKKRYGAYGIDYSMLDIYNTSIIHAELRQKMFLAKKTRTPRFIDKQMFALGLEAASSLSDTDIKHIVQAAFDVGSLIANSKWSFLPTRDELIKKLCKNRNKLVKEHKSPWTRLLEEAKATLKNNKISPAKEPTPVVFRKYGSNGTLLSELNYKA